MQNKSHDINAKQILKNKMPGDGLQSQLSVLTTSNKQFFFKFIHIPRAKPVPKAQTRPRRGQGVDKEYKSGGRSDACRGRKLQLPRKINIYHFHLLWNDSRVETNKNRQGAEDKIHTEATSVGFERVFSSIRGSTEASRKVGGVTWTSAGDKPSVLRARLEREQSCKVKHVPRAKTQSCLTPCE